MSASFGFIIRLCCQHVGHVEGEFGRAPFTKKRRMTQRELDSGAIGRVIFSVDLASGHVFHALWVDIFQRLEDTGDLGMSPG